MAKPLELQPPVNVDDQTASGRSWPVHSWARYIQLGQRLSSLNHAMMQHNTSPHTGTCQTWYNAPLGTIGSFACTRRVCRFQAQAIT